MRKSIYITSKNRFIYLESDTVEHLYIAHSKDDVNFDVIIKYKCHDGVILGIYMDKGLAIAEINSINSFLLDELSTTYITAVEIK